jgi:hypothetical protein
MKYGSLKKMDNSTPDPFDHLDIEVTLEENEEEIEKLLEDYKVYPVHQCPCCGALVQTHREYICTTSDRTEPYE